MRACSPSGVVQRRSASVVCTTLRSAIWRQHGQRAGHLDFKLTAGQVGEGIGPLGDGLGAPDENGFHHQQVRDGIANSLALEGSWLVCACVCEGAGL